MEPILPAESNELFLDTLFRVSSKILISSDEEIEHDLFEEFDAGAVSFLHEWTLDRLLEHGFIDSEIKTLSLALREKALFLLEHKRDLDSVKTDAEWMDLFRLADKIINLKKRFDASKAGFKAG
jgi:hypothetical protein